jgi:threonine/homoserine/homoserine lactone efflux protein
LTNLSNPKSALFFGSVFSAALPTTPDAIVLAAAVMLIVLNALCWHLLLAFLFSRKAVQAGYAAKVGLFARLAGAIVGALGMSLLVASLSEARRSP